MTSYQKEISTSLRTKEEAEKFFGCPLSFTPYKIFIPLLLAEEIKKQGINSPLGKQYIPTLEENIISGFKDPIGDGHHHVTSTLIHRYPGRALFLPIKTCPVVCRFCFRKNLLNEKDESPSDFEETLNYLRKHTEISEIIFSGGDPLLLPDNKIKYYLEEFSKISHIKYLRFHTRIPLVLPNRMTDSLINLIKNSPFKRKVINIHINHESELFLEPLKAIEKLSKEIEVKTQTVLLKGINDSPDDLIKLFTKIIDLGATPYYLHHPDLVQGGTHFYLSIEEGRKIYQKLRLKLPGWAIPQYVLDTPTGMGKIPLFNPEQYEFNGKILNLDGEIKDYPTFPFTN